jgi:hypothetical protein
MLIKALEERRRSYFRSRSFWCAELARLLHDLSDPPLDGALALTYEVHLHQVVKRTFTFKLQNMAPEREVHIHPGNGL